MRKKINEPLLYTLSTMNNIFHDIYLIQLFKIEVTTDRIAMDGYFICPIFFGLAKLTFIRG